MASKNHTEYTVVNLYAGCRNDGRPLSNLYPFTVCTIPYILSHFRQSLSGQIRNALFDDVALNVVYLLVTSRSSSSVGKNYC